MSDAAKNLSPVPRTDAPPGSDVYRVEGWGRPYFAVSEAGTLEVSPSPGDPQRIDLHQLANELSARGIELPVLIRFPNILQHRIQLLDRCFRDAMREAKFEGDYEGVYPVKVNQQRHLVEDVVEFGEHCRVGLEAGSKPELLIALAAQRTPGGLIICNGYKDAAFMELAIAAQQLDRRVIIVLERPEELDLALEAAERVGVTPLLGVRARLHARGSGRWGSSSGPRAKFGLSIPQILEVVSQLKELGLEDCLQLLHFHIGSQISSILPFKEAMREASRLYVELDKLGCGMRYLDVGGGLAVDYDGTCTDFQASKNYDVREYALDVVYGIQEACDRAGVRHPTLITESGRALAAYQSVLVFEVVGTNEAAQPSKTPRDVAAHPLIDDLREVIAGLNPKNLQEAWHDAQQTAKEAQGLFRFGILSLAQMGEIETLFRDCCHRISELLRGQARVPEELKQLQALSAAIYYCNFSIFQSAPDAWAIDQVFPIVPIHRLNEAPEVNAVLADLTCDSDGILDRFIGYEAVQPVLPLHAVRPGEPYLLGMFLNGAYQEILGDLHNLFGDTHAVHVRLKGDGYDVEHVIPGDSIEEVLRYVQYEPQAMVETVRQQAELAVRASRLTLPQMRLLLERYQESLRGYTYLGEAPCRVDGVPMPAQRPLRQEDRDDARQRAQSLRPPQVSTRSAG